MTTLRPNKSTANATNTTPIKVALIGLTMIQQALLAFYFATKEGAQKYTEVLGKDAEAFITNFDEQGAIEAWENLYAQENKPTLIFSNCHKTVNNYLYFPRPITPNLLLDAANAINNLLEIKQPNEVQDACKSTLNQALDTSQDSDVFLLAEDIMTDSMTDELSSIEALIVDTNVDESATIDALIASPKLPHNNTIEIPTEIRTPSVDTTADELTTFEALITSSKSPHDNTAKIPATIETPIVDTSSNDVITAEALIASSKSSHSNTAETPTTIETPSIDTSYDELTTFDELIASSKSPQNNTVETPIDTDTLSVDTNFDELTSFDELIASSKSSHSNIVETPIDELIAFESIDTKTVDARTTGIDALDFNELTLSKPVSTTDKKETITLLEQTHSITTDNNQISFQQKPDNTTADKEPELTLIENTSAKQTTLKEEQALSFDASLLHNSPAPLSTTKNKDSKNEEKITSPDELQSLLDELDKQEKEKKKQQKKEVQKKSTKKTKEQQRWIQLSGKYTNSNYAQDDKGYTRFNLAETLLPYLSDTIDFTKRAECWMELSYQPLSILVDPDNNMIYSSLSLEDPQLVQICGRKIVEELIEYLEVDTHLIEQINDEKSKNKLFKYDTHYFKWTLSLLVSHGRLPENCNPDERISITNWLSLNKVEKFPYIMQIAAVFNQHHASLNEAAKWMTLPKRYVYAFYNGILALDMINKTPEESKKKKLIATSGSKDNNLFKNLLFKKII